MLRSLDKGIFLTENCPSFRGKIRSFYLLEGMGVFSLNMIAADPQSKHMEFIGKYRKAEIHTF
jgi:hypothetical protein